MFWLMQRHLIFHKDSYNYIGERLGEIITQFPSDLDQKMRTKLLEKHMWFYQSNVSRLFKECHCAFSWTMPLWNLPFQFRQKVAKMYQLCQIAWSFSWQCFNFASRIYICNLINKPFGNLPFHFEQNVTRMCQLCQIAWDNVETLYQKCTVCLHGQLILRSIDAFWAKCYKNVSTLSDSLGFILTMFQLCFKNIAGHFHD